MHSLAILVMVVSMVVGAQDSPSRTKASLQDLNWLAGSWVMESKGERIEENWTSPAGGMMLATGRSVQENKTVEFEFLRIEQRGEGLVYVAQPGGRPPVEFWLASVGKDEWVFENKKHDFPQRIRYQRTGANAFTARIEDATGAKHMEFPYTRVP